MFKKSFLLLCALIAAYAPIAAEDAITKGKKCCNCRSLSVTGNASIGGSLNVGGSETVGGDLTVTGDVRANSFILPSGGALFNGLRNWAVFSNDAAVTTGNTVLWAATDPDSVSAGITNTAGNITLPVNGTFLVMYTVRIAIAASSSGSATAQLQQTTANVFGAIGQPAVNSTADAIPAATAIETQISGYAIVNTTSTSNNRINLLITLSTGFTVDTAVDPDANAQLTILQLN